MANATNFIDEIVTVINSTATQVITKIAIAIVILLVGFLVGKFLGKLITKLLHEIELDKILSKTTKVEVMLEHTSGLFITYFIYFITIVTALNQIGLTTTLLQIIAGAVIVLIILSVAIGVKDFIPNAFAGFFLYRKKDLNIGDKIEFKGLEGKIIKISLTEIIVETKRGDNIFIPTSALTKTEFVRLKKSKKKIK